MRTLIGESISRVRNLIKARNQDSLLTDRQIFSVIVKHVHWLVKREDGQNKLMRFDSIFQTLDFVELEEIDKIEAGCSGIQSGCTFRRTVNKLPDFIHGYYGPLIRSVTSIDSSQELQKTNPSTFSSIQSSKSFKYNKTLYYWYLNGRLYFPNIDWDSVRVEGVFIDDISQYNCEPEDNCIPKQNQIFNIPEYLLGEMESQVLKDFGFSLQVPTDLVHDKQNINR
jgi:hypothetical protein